MNEPTRAEAHSTFIDPAITPEADRAQLRSSNPAKYVVGSVLSLGDDPRNVKYSGWYVHETGHDEGASGPGFVLIRPNPPGAGDDADAGGSALDGCATGSFSLHAKLGVAEDVESRVQDRRRRRATARVFGCLDHVAPIRLL